MASRVSSKSLSALSGAEQLPRVASDEVRRVSIGETSSGYDLTPRLVKEELTIIRPQQPLSARGASERQSVEQTVSMLSTLEEEDRVSRLVKTCVERERRERQTSLSKLQGDLLAQQEAMAAFRVQLDVVCQGRGLVCEETKSMQDCEAVMTQLRSHLNGTGASDAGESRISRGGLDATDVAALRREFEGLRASMGITGERLEAIKREVAAVAAGASGLAAETKAELNAEAVKRANGNEEVLSRVKILTSECAMCSREQAALRDEIEELRANTATATKHLQELSARLRQEASQRQTSTDSTLTCLAELREDLEAESRDRAVASEMVAKVCKDALEQERAERQRAHDSLRADFVARLSPLERDVTTIHARLQDVEGAMTSRPSGPSVDEMSEQVLCTSRIEKQCAELGRSLELEAKARSTLADDFERVVKAQRVKLRSLVTQISDTVKKSYDELRSSTEAMLQKERSAHSAQQTAIESRVVMQQDALDTLRRNIGELELRHREENAARGLREELSQVKAETPEEVAARIRRDVQHELSRGEGVLKKCLAEERASREALERTVSERLSPLEVAFRELRELFLSSSVGNRENRKVLSRPSPRRSSLPLEHLWSDGSSPSLASSALASERRDQGGTPLPSPLPHAARLIQRDVEERARLLNGTEG